MRKKQHWRAKERNKAKDFKFSAKEEEQRKWMTKMLIKKHSGRCVCCGVIVNLVHDDPLQASIDHIIPLSKGGSEELENLQLMCRKCNIEKDTDIIEGFY